MTNIKVLILILETRNCSYEMKSAFQVSRVSSFESYEIKLQSFEFEFWEFKNQFRSISIYYMELEQEGV